MNCTIAHDLLGINIRIDAIPPVPQIPVTPYNIYKILTSILARLKFATFDSQSKKKKLINKSYTVFNAMGFG